LLTRTPSKRMNPSDFESFMASPFVDGLVS
jgi:hypothetical protein